MRVLLWVWVLLALPVFAAGKADKLVDLNFEYVRLVYAVAQDCAKTAETAGKAPADKQGILELSRCYSFLLEKREKLEREVFVPLRRLGFPSGNLREKDKEFVKMVYVMDDAIDDIGKTAEPLFKSHMPAAKAKKKAKKGAK